MPPPALGTLIHQRYEIRRKLGHGASGEVYEVFDHYQKNTAALKLLPSLAGSGNWAEAEVLTQLKSPYILEVWNADVEAGVPFIVTEVAQYGSADSPMEPHGVPPEKAVRWVRHASRGAARAHDERLIHRDIKPANIFLGAQGEARLGDFGIAHLTDENGQAPSAGTLVTMAPEVVAGGPCSVAGDVYSLGASLYALLGGRYAHDGPVAQVVAAAVINDPPTPLRDLAPHVSLALEKRVRKAMSKDPADRYQSAEAFDTALGELPVHERDWRRTDEHPAHQGCWRGEGPGKAAVTVCLVPSGGRLEVVALHQPTERRINKACRPAASQSKLARNLRAAIGALS